MTRGVLVIRDVASLAALAAAETLDVLLKLNMPILFVDEVFYAATCEETEPEEVAIKQFVAANGEVIRIVQTEVGRLASDERIRNPNYRRYLPDEGVAEFFDRVDEYVDPACAIFILVERAVRKQSETWAANNIFLLSTNDLMTASGNIDSLGLENMIRKSPD